MYLNLNLYIFESLYVNLSLLLNSAKCLSKMKEVEVDIFGALKLLYKELLQGIHDQYGWRIRTKGVIVATHDKSGQLWQITKRGRFLCTSWGISRGTSTRISQINRSSGRVAQAMTIGGACVLERCLSECAFSILLGMCFFYGVVAQPPLAHVYRY